MTMAQTRMAQVNRHYRVTAAVSNQMMLKLMMMIVMLMLMTVTAMMT